MQQDRELRRRLVQSRRRQNFFFFMLIITTMRGIDLHPMNYFFLAAAFFSFHLLLAYLVDHMSIHAAFALSSLVSVALVVSYLRLVVGIGFARFTGLAITIRPAVDLS